MNDKQKKTSLVTTYLCSAFILLALLASLNVYFNLIDLQQEISVSNDFIAGNILFLVTSFLTGLIVVNSAPVVRDKPIRLMSLCMVSYLPVISFLLLVFEYVAWSHLSMIIVCTGLFITNEVAFRNQYYTEQAYRSLQITTVIYFICAALIIHKTNAISVLLG